MCTVGARPATADDIEALEALRRQAEVELGSERGGAVLLATRAATWAITDAVGDPARLAAVGCIDDVVVGFALVALHERLATLAEVRALYVEPQARAIGVGEALIELVTVWCRERGCKAIDAIVLPGMREPKNFFETFGFTARAIVVHHRLD